MTRIAISRASGSEKYLRYAQWLKTAQADVDCVDLYELEQKEGLQAALNSLKTCSGIVFSGGSDVEPSRYQKADQVTRCHVDPARDTLEFALVEYARELKIPILGICRGMQLLNVAFGGSLIVDIPEDYSREIEHMAINGVDARHAVDVEAGTTLRRIVRRADGEINSAHHQAVELLAPDFEVAARSPDGIIEAFETLPELGRSHVMAVQWHPERLEYENPFSGALAEYFVFECQSTALLTSRLNLQ